MGRFVTFSDRILLMLIFDAHLDLSMNALEWNRDLTRGIERDS